MPEPSLYDELIRCTVRIAGDGVTGTGFLVAPGRVLTAAHVALGTAGRGEVRVFVSGQDLPATLVGTSPVDDAALLAIPLHDHPCVLLDERCAPRDAVFLYGFPGREAGVRGESVTARCEGPVEDQDGPRTQTFLKFTPGGVRPGMSGAPLLDEETGAVCAIVKRTRSTELDQGGLAVPLAGLWTAFPGLREANAAYHRDHDAWRRASERSGAALLGRLGRAPPTLAERIPQLQFRTLIEDRTTGFVGRDFVFAEIDRALQDPAVPAGYVLVTGEPGIGKTALMAWLVRTRGWVHHFNVATMNIRTPRQFVENVTSQLMVKYGLPLRQPPAEVGRYGAYLDGVLRAAAARQPGAPIVVLVDALDEATDEQLPAGANRLFLPAALPAGVHVVATSRPLQSHRLGASAIRTIVISDEGADNLRDAAAYVARFVDAYRQQLDPVLQRWGLDAAAFVAALTEHSEGNFMYLRHVLPDIRDGRFDRAGLDDIRALPRGLTEYYQAHWRQARDRDPSRFERVTKPVVCMFATAKEPVTIEQVVRWTHARWPELGVGEVQEVIADWRQFLDELRVGRAAPTYRVYHLMFREFLEKVEGLGLFHDLIIEAALCRGDRSDPDG